METNAGNPAPRHLTRRQAECVELVAKGLSSKEIARELGISPSTVDNHVAAVMHQLNIPNRNALSRYIGPEQSYLAQRWAVDPEGDKLVEGIGENHFPSAAPCACAYCSFKNYVKTSMLPSLLFAAQTAVFIVILLFGLKVSFDLVY